MLYHVRGHFVNIFLLDAPNGGSHCCISEPTQSRIFMYEYRRRSRWLRAIPAPSKAEALLLASVAAFILGEVAFFWFRQNH